MASYANSAAVVPLVSASASPLKPGVVSAHYGAAIGAIGVDGVGPSSLSPPLPPPLFLSAAASMAVAAAGLNYNNLQSAAAAAAAAAASAAPQTTSVTTIANVRVRNRLLLMMEWMMERGDWDWKEWIV